MKNPTKVTLADKIAGILNTAPTNFDPEEEAVDDTNAQTTFEDVEDIEENEILSKFRTQNIDLLADIDEKYAGKKTSRKNLRDSSDEDEVLSYNEDSEAGDDYNNKSLKHDSIEDDSEDDEESQSEEEEEGGEEDEGSAFSNNEDESNDLEDIGKNFKHTNDINISNQVKKGICVRNQMAMWEDLLEVRIQMQKCLVTANKMPSNVKFKEIKVESGPEFSEKVSETKHILCKMLDKLLVLQKLVLKQYPETRNYEKQTEEGTSSHNGSDEEILSDTELDFSEQEESVEVKSSRKRKLIDYENDIDNQHKKYKNYRNDVIKKWHDKTKVALKGDVASHSVLDQIEYNLNNNKHKLIRRTQLKRSQYNILGENENSNEDNTGEVYNTEIFDDDDFYHQLLRELIELKSADITDPIQLGRQWIQLQNMRSKMKRKVDTRATKGRKIRYAVHSKLVNFMAPIDEGTWTDEARTELFGSLFGKN